MTRFEFSRKKRGARPFASNFKNYDPHRVYLSSLIFSSCRDCPPYLASAETVRDLLLPVETTVHEKWLPAETVRVILISAETLGRKLNHTESLQEVISQAQQPLSSSLLFTAANALPLKRTHQEEHLLRKKERKLYRLPAFVKVAENMKVHHTPQLFHSFKFILSAVASTIEIPAVASLLSMYGKLPEL